MISFQSFRTLFACLCLLNALTLLAPVRAEVILDGSLGRQGAIPLGMQKTYAIDASVGRVAGNNLFHSFSRFNLESGTLAHFTDNQNSAIAHVIARVTGGSPSELNGTLTQV